MTTLTKTILTAAALLAGASQVQAAPQRLTDTAYLQAVRCRGLAQTQGVDIAAMNAMIKAQKGGRDSYIGDRARTVERDAKREVSRAGEYEKTRIAAELEGACAAYVTPSSEMASRR